MTYHAKYRGRFSSSLHYTRAARKALGLGENETRIEGSRTLHGALPDGRPVRLLVSKKLRGAPRGRGLMRLQIQCSSCKRWIPAGRLGQHEGSENCYTGWSKSTKTRRDPAKKRSWKSATYVVKQIAGGKHPLWHASMYGSRVVGAGGTPERAIRDLQEQLRRRARAGR